MKLKRIVHLLAPLVVSAALLFSATSALAASKDLCSDQGGIWIGSDAANGDCIYPVGSSGWSVTCIPDGLYIVVFEEGIVSEAYCVFPISGSSHAPGIYCGPIDLPAIIAPSAATPISFKGTIQTSGATLLVPGIDGSFPVENLSYDWASNTWSGTVNTLNIPPDKYQNVRLRVFDNDDAGKNCNIGGLTVSDRTSPHDLIPKPLAERGFVVNRHLHYPVYCPMASAELGHFEYILMYLWMLFVAIYLLIILYRHQKHNTFLPHYMPRMYLAALAYVLGSVVLIALFPQREELYRALQTTCVLLISAAFTQIVFANPDEGALTRQPLHWNLLRVAIAVAFTLNLVNFIGLFTGWLSPTTQVYFDAMPIVFTVWSRVILTYRFFAQRYDREIDTRSRAHLITRNLWIFAILGIALTLLINLFDPGNRSRIADQLIRSYGIMIVVTIEYFILTHNHYAGKFRVQRIALSVGLVTLFVAAGIYAAFFNVTAIPTIDTSSFALLLSIEVAVGIAVIALLPWLIDRMLPHLQLAAPPNTVVITPRQREVLQLVAQGLSNKEIGERLTITEATAKYHVSNLLVEYNCRTRYELAQYAKSAPRPETTKN